MREPLTIGGKVPFLLLVKDLHTSYKGLSSESLSSTSVLSPMASANMHPSTGAASKWFEYDVAPWAHAFEHLFPVVGTVEGGSWNL